MDVAVKSMTDIALGALFLKRGFFACQFCGQTLTYSTPWCCLIEAATNSDGPRIDAKHAAVQLGRFKYTVTETLFQLTTH